ncbi:MAG: DNA repair protein RecO, partial [Anaerolineae bacterium]|nr:DNA repair protein RecO [Anaerolineae bacterium]
SLYTKQRGKIRAVAKGARKLRSRKGGHLQPFTHISLQLARTKGPYLITQVESINAFLPLRGDLHLTGNASYLLELLDRFTYDEEEKNPSIFSLLLNSLSRLAENHDTWLVIRYYEMRLLDYLGFRPQLFHCANCETEIKAENQFFSAVQGGVLCPQCGVGQASARSVSIDEIKYLRHFQRSSYESALRANPQKKTRADVEMLMQFYLTYVLERGLNSPQFLKEINR